MNHIIRLAEKNDSAAILRIYAPYITDSAVSFETEVPSVGDFANRIESICEIYPYLVYLVDGKIIGYAYASKHRERAAYRFDVDVSVYVLPEYHGQGVANRLYSCLFRILKELGYCNAYAGYTVPNEKSMRFHEKSGFTYVGTYYKTGFKLGRWHDVVWVGKVISEHAENPPEPKSIRDLPADYIKNLLANFTLQD